jgi:hypothetical protein
MPKDVVLRTRVEALTAAQIQLEAARARTSTSQWIANILRRELSRAGAADALAPRTYELVMTVGYMLRSLMIDAMGPDPAMAAVEEAAAEAADDASEELRRMRALL